MPINFDEIQQNAMVEIRPTVMRSSAIQLVNYNDRYNYVGFTSVYGFYGATLEKISDQGSTKNLMGLPMFTDVLFIDFDNNEEAASRLQQRLSNYRYQMYTTGGRSVHFHIPTNPMYGIYTPHSQKTWIKENAPEADMSIYRTSGLYRLPGTYHADNPGKKKELIYENQALEILHIDDAPPMPQYNLAGDSDSKDHNAILGSLIRKSVDMGGRNPHAYKIAINAKYAGIEYFRAKRLLYMWNCDNCHPPKENWELEKLLDWVWKNG